MKPLLPDVTVNGETIPAALIAAEAQNHPAPKGKPGLAWQAAARALAIRALLLQEARGRGLCPEPRETDPGKFETGEEALIRQLLEVVVAPRSISDADLRAEYETHPDRFVAPALYEAAHILLPVAPDDSQGEAAALTRAGELLALLAVDPARFADIARAESACGSAANGGRLGQISTGDTVPEFEAALADLPEGAIRPDSVRSRYGVHIVRLDARAEGAVLPFAAVEKPLRQALEKAAWAQAARAFIAELARGARIEGIALAAA